MSRIINIGVIMSVTALIIAGGVAWTMNVDGQDYFHYDYDLGTYSLVEGQTIEVDLDAVMDQRMGLEDMDTIAAISIDADHLPSWISISEDGRTMTISPVAPASVDCEIHATIDVAHGGSSYTATNDIAFSVIATGSDAVASGIVGFDAGNGAAGWSSSTFVEGGTVVLPGCVADGGEIFTGWYSDGEKVGNAGDVYSPTAGEIVVAGYVEDPDYVEPGAYAWTITLAMACLIAAITFIAAKYGSAERD